MESLWEGQRPAERGPPSQIPKAAPARMLWVLLVVVVGVGFVVLAFLGIRPTEKPVSLTPTPSATLIAEVRVPNFVGSSTSSVQKASEFLAVHIVFVDERGREFPSPYVAS
jgi:hypothetical protein